MLLGLAFGAATIVLAATGHGFSYNKNGFGFGGGEEFTISPPLALLSATGALLLLGATLLLWQPPESQPQTGGRVNVAIQSK